MRLSSRYFPLPGKATALTLSYQADTQCQTDRRDQEARDEINEVAALTYDASTTDGRVLGPMIEGNVARVDPKVSVDGLFAVNQS